MTDDFRVPLPPELADGKLQDLAKQIRAQLPDGWGFGLFLFNYGEGGSMVWVSSAERATILEALHEFLRKQAS
jgi:GTPase